VSRVVYIDPGVHRCAVALFEGGALRAVYWRPTTAPACVFNAVARAVVELPKVRPGSRVRTDDLIALAAAGGRVAGNLPVMYISPESWKGQVPCTCTAKNRPEDCTHHRRMAAALTPAERKIVDECGVIKSKLHNVYDAVTMGLKLEGRLDA
jgi:hypothetical protein